MTYVRRTFASHVAVSCRRRARPLAFNTRILMHHKNMTSLLDNVNKKVKLGMLSEAQKQKIIKNFLEKKPSVPRSPPPHVKFTSGMSKSTVRGLINAGYTFSPATKQKIKNLFSREVSNGTPVSPINFRNKSRPPSPPRKKTRVPTPSPPRKKVPTPSRSNLDKAKSVVAKMKTIKARKEYRRLRAVNMSLENWKELGRYINQLNYNKRKRLTNARQLKKKVNV